MNEYESTALTTFSASAAPAIATPKGKNYLVNCGNVSTVQLKRGVDFGVIPKTKKPSLYKSGAEKICMGYKVLPIYEIESKIESFGKEPFFHYVIKCNLIKIVNGTVYTITNGYGSANTYESRNGNNSSYNSANATLKMAQKRALTSAALAISGLSDAFTQDMENEDFMQNAAVLVQTDAPDAPVSSKQIKRLYAIGGDAGLNVNEVKQILAAAGYTSTKDILQKDYESICNTLREKGK